MLERLVRSEVGRVARAGLRMVTADVLLQRLSRGDVGQVSHVAWNGGPSCGLCGAFAS
jgi:hypothetical protein